ncbi:hypothetical protein, partial [Bacteroides sp. 224]|uniref:hypothetical protein n=1 Tax=Bacteroides sp. 224 TaxID=2302936 RepID=UPI00194039BE
LINRIFKKEIEHKESYFRAKNKLLRLLSGCPANLKTQKKSPPRLMGILAKNLFYRTALHSGVC